MSLLAEALKRPGLLVADGAVGTWLMAKGGDPKELPLLPLDHPDVVLNSHVEYLRAGARMLETHTFSANASKLAAMGLTVSVGDLNRRAAQLARHARDVYGEPAFVMGSLGPLAAPVDAVIGTGIPYAQAVQMYREAIGGLLAGGVDGFVVETMSDSATVKAAVAAVRQESDLPIMVLFAFSPLGTTLYGLSPEEAVQLVGDLPGGPPAVVGANCGSGPSPLLDAVLRMAPMARERGMALAAFPNAGQPALKEGHIHYPANPDYMAAIAPALFKAGCAVVGGCCGTTPQYVEAIRESLSRPSLITPEQMAPPEETVPAKPGEVPDGIQLSDLFAKKFVISVELDPPRGVNPRRLLEAARVVYDAGADAINVGDSPMARVRLSALATSRLINETLPMATILHFTTRDRNLMGLQSDLLGAYALGIRNVLALTGDPPGLGDYAHATAVYDIDSVGLAKVLEGFNQGVDAVGHKLGSPTTFDIGVGVNPNFVPLDQEVDRFRRKLDAGATYAMVQPIYAPDQWFRFLDKMGSVSVPVLLGLMPLVSYRQALYLHNEVPGIIIPEPILKRLEGIQDGASLGVEMMMSLIETMFDAVQGVYLVPSYNRVEPLLPLIERIRQLEASRADQ